MKYLFVCFFMEQKFSRQLKKQLIDYFKNNYDLEITSKQAEIYLDSLADFYFIVIKKEKRPKDAF